MTSSKPDRITVRTFSSIFEKMCNFIAVAKTGDPQTTVRGLIKLCLLEFPNEHFDSPVPIRETIETLFGLAIPDDQIETALNELEKEKAITSIGNTNYRLEPIAMTDLKRAIDNSRELENRVKASWFEQLELNYPDLSVDDAWKVLRSYLCRTFRRHGIQAAALLDPIVDKPKEHLASLTSILHEAIDENESLDKRFHSDVEIAISNFMASVGNDADHAHYITQLADGAFNYFTLEVPTDLSEQFRKQLQQLTLFLDTNFLFGILDLHYNPQVQVSHDLLRAIKKHNLPFSLRYHEATQKEMASTISYYGEILRSRVWTRSLSSIAAKSRNLSGIEQKFHEKNAAELIDVEEFLRPYEHFDNLLAEDKNIKVFRPHTERSDAQGKLFQEYEEFLKKNGRSDNPYEIVMHDAKVLEEVRNLRSNVPSSLEAGALMISCDYFLYRFDWETSRRDGRLVCVLLPNVFWQILRPFVPADLDFEKSFAETFALPEFRAIGSGSGRACSKMLQILATYKGLSEQTAMKMLANDLLLDRLRSERDETKFEEQVEAAFIEENRNLLEEKAALEQELKRQKARTEEEARKRQEDQTQYEDTTKKLNKAIADAGQQLESASCAIKEHEKSKIDAVARVTAAEKLAEDARKKAEAATNDKSNAEREAFRMRVFAGFTLSICAVIVFLTLTHFLPWVWLVSHKNTILLQIFISSTLFFTFLGFFVTAWRKWCWGVGVTLFLPTLLSLMSN
jgi:hypothetical protein